MTQSHILTAEKGASYSLMDASTEQTVDGLVLKKQGDTLIIEVDGEVLIQIDEFYLPGQLATFNTGDVSTSGDTVFISSTDAAADDSGVVWQASEISGLAAGDETDSNTGLILGGLAVVGIAAALSSSGGGGGSDSPVLEVTPPVAPVVPPEVADTTIVVFDLIGGTSSDHSGRIFQANVQYDIYIRVNSITSDLNTDARSNEGTWAMWSGAENIDNNDIIHLVGSGPPIRGSISGIITGVSVTSSLITWYSTSGVAVSFNANGLFWRTTFTSSDSVDLWGGRVLNSAFRTSHVDFTNTMPGTIMTTQGLA